MTPSSQLKSPSTPKRASSGFLLALTSPPVSSLSAPPKREENLARRPDSSFSIERLCVESGAGGFHSLWLTGEVVRGIRGRGEVE